MTAVPKPKRYENKTYLKFVKSMACIVCYNESDAHHVKTVGSGGSDLTSVPLCRKHHSEIHQIGPVKFKESHGKCLKEEQIRCLESFIMHQYPC